jgi:hypothetical protein
MEPTGSAATTRDFYDRLNDPKQPFLMLGGLLLFIIFFVTPFWWSHDPFFLLLCCLLVPTILLGLPRVVHEVFLAYRGAPALRISDQGIWSRQWSSLGWINWRDIASVRIVSGQTGTSHEIFIRLCDKKFSQLAGRDQVSVMLARMVGFLLSNDQTPNTLRLTGSSQLTGSWENLMATLDPILAANGVAVGKD